MKQNKGWPRLFLTCLLASVALWGGVSAAADPGECDHVWGEWTTTTAATCTTTGEKIQRCTINPAHEQTETIPIDDKAHSWSGEWVTTTAATCTAKGEKRQYCTINPDHWQSEEIPIDPDAHVYGEWEITKQATCSAEGVRTKYCVHDRSHDTQTETVSIDTEAHDWKWTVTQPATCSEQGSKKGVCAHDSTHALDSVPIDPDPNAHVWSEWETKKKATCTAKGSKTRFCTLDENHTETKAISALEHNWGDWSISRNCTTSGKKTRQCRHDSSHRQTETIPASGHDWGKWKVTKRPTVSAEGIEKRVCGRDSNHTESRKIEKIPGIKLSDKTTVDLDGLMKWDEKIYPNNPVIRVNGKRLSDLSRNEKLAIDENPRIMEFLTALYQNPWGAPNVMYEGDIRIEVDRTRLLALVNEASKRQKSDEAKQEYMYYHQVTPTPNPNSTPTPTPAPTPKVEITLVFKKEEEKKKFEEDNRDNDDIKFETIAPPPTPQKKKCLTPDTLIALADGSEKRVDELTETDRLQVWDFEEGCLSDAPMTFYHYVEEEAPVLRVSFSDGTSVGIVGEHVFFDLTERAFVVIQAADQEERLKGHRFAKLENGQIAEVTLTGIREDGTTDSYYSPVTEVHFNCFANGMLNISGFMQGFYNVFDLEEDALKYDAEKKAADLAASGEVTWEYFSELFPRELFERNRVGWLSVAVDKGLISAGELYELFDFCVPFFVGSGTAE